MFSGNHPPSVVKVERVIHAAKAALDDYQLNKRYDAAVGAGDLLPIKSAEFTFRTERGTGVGASAGLYVFSLGASADQNLVNEMTFTYSVPGSRNARSARQIAKQENADIQDLVDSVVAAAKAVQGAHSMGPLQYSELKVDLSYSVAVTGSVGVEVPFKIVTVGANAKVSKNSVQEIKLTFAKP